MGVDLYRRWTASTHRDDEHSEKTLQTINRRNPPTSIPCREPNENRLTNGNHGHRESSPRVRSRTKKYTSVFKIERRKTFTDELLDEDVRFLMKKTEFTREQIVVWHGDFLVGPIDLCISTDFSVSFQSRLSRRQTLENEIRRDLSAVLQERSSDEILWTSISYLRSWSFRIHGYDSISFSRSLKTSFSLVRFRWIPPGCQSHFFKRSRTEDRTVLCHVWSRFERSNRRTWNALFPWSKCLSRSTRLWCCYSVHLVDLWIDGHWYKWSIAHR